MGINWKQPFYVYYCTEMSSKFAYKVCTSEIINYAPRKSYTTWHVSNLHVQFSNLCGAVYKQGSIAFTSDGNSVLSPVGNRISQFDLKK